MPNLGLKSLSLTQKLLTDTHLTTFLWLAGALNLVTILAYTWVGGLSPLVDEILGLSFYSYAYILFLTLIIVKTEYFRPKLGGLTPQPQDTTFITRVLHLSSSKALIFWLAVWFFLHILADVTSFRYCLAPGMAHTLKYCFGLAILQAGYRQLTQPKSGQLAATQVFDSVLQVLKNPASFGELFSGPKPGQTVPVTQFQQPKKYQGSLGEQVLQVITEKGQVKMGDLMRALNRPHNSIWYQLQVLEKKSVIVQVGQRKAAFYRLASPVLSNPAPSCPMPPNPASPGSAPSNPVPSNPETGVKT